MTLGLRLLQELCDLLMKVGPLRPNKPTRLYQPSILWTRATRDRPAVRKEEQDVSMHQNKIEFGTPLKVDLAVLVLIQGRRSRCQQKMLANSLDNSSTVHQTRTTMRPSRISHHAMCRRRSLNGFAIEQPVQGKG